MAGIFMPFSMNLTATTAPLSIVLQIAGVVETVGVVAPKLEEELPQIVERGGVRAQTITAAEIQSVGYYDVAQALQALVPGLFLTPKAGPFDYVTASFQGSRTNEILWLVDGVRISNRLYNGTTPLDTIPAHMPPSCSPKSRSCRTKPFAGSSTRTSTRIARAATR